MEDSEWINWLSILLVAKWMLYALLEPIQVEKIPPRTIRIGKSASFPCIVAEGEATEFMWSKEGQLIREDAKYRITTFPENSLLTIRNVDQNDAGTYICVAKNSFSESRTSATLRVEGT